MSPRDPLAVQPRLFLAILAGALVVFALLAWRFNFLCDDAYISFRYAQNAAEGHGLRYNLAVSGPVEGYTNFLWSVWLACAHWIGLDMLVVSRLTSVLCGGLLVAWILRHARNRLALGTSGLVVTGFFVATLPPIALWATSGLEQIALAFTLFAAYERLLGDPAKPHAIQAGLLLATGALLRADGMVFGAMLLGSGLFLLPGAEDRKRTLRALLTAGAWMALAVAAHMLWRHATYGGWLPNTAKAKAGFSPDRMRRGYEYALSYPLAFPSVALVVALSLRSWRGGWTHLWLPAGAIVAGTFAYVIYVGGDFMPMGRFLLPALPFVVLLLAGVCRQLSERWTWSLGALLVGLNLLACFDVQVVPISLQKRFHFREDREWMTEVAKWHSLSDFCSERAEEARLLAPFVKPSESIILGAIGATGYYTRMEVFDVYGLVSPSVLDVTSPLKKSSPGHDRRVTYGHFLPRKPTFLGFEIVESGADLWGHLPKRIEQTPLPELIEIESYPVEGGREVRLYRLR